MTSGDQNELVDRYLAEGDPEDGRRVAEALRGSPEAIDAYWRQVRVHAALRGALAAGSTERGGKRAVSASQMKQIRKKRWYARSAAAALLSACIALALARRDPDAVKASPPPSGASPFAAFVRAGPAGWSGRTILAEEIIEAPAPMDLDVANAEVKLHLESGTRCILQPRPSRMQVRLERGDLTLVVEPRPSDRPFIVSTPHAKVQVVGTGFRVQVANGTLVTVGHGAVDVTSHGTSARLTAEWTAWTGGVTPPVTCAPLAEVLEDFATGAGFWTHVPPDRVTLTAGAAGIFDPGRCEIALSEGSRIVRLYAPGTEPDWSAHAGISLVMRGQGRGETLGLCVLTGQAHVRGDRWVADIVDDRTGWREIRLEFAGFRRRTSRLPSQSRSLTLTAR